MIQQKAIMIAAEDAGSEAGGLQKACAMLLD